MHIRQISLATGLLFWLLMPIFIGLAVSTYEGGTVFDSTSVGYDLRYNQLSDLGRYRTYSEVSNEKAQFHLRRAIWCGAVGALLIHLVWLSLFRRERARKWGAASFLLLLVGSAHLIAWCHIPADTNYPRHQIFAFRAITALALSFFLAVGATYFAPKYKNVYAYVWGSIALGATIIMVLLYVRPHAWSSIETMAAHTLTQLIWVVVLFIGYILQAVRVFRGIRSRMQW